ncbi:MAG: AMP-binding acetyl-CoA synthetase [Terriglobia bacterium]|nr:MAG: AMP-binding acetyl-CoA synthetase [Terriglobia bacterium]
MQASEERAAGLLREGQANGVTESDLPLQSVYRWERERAARIFLTQPIGGKAYHWTWAEALDEARRIAAYLQDQHWEPGTRIAILSKNCAWWILADLAIWMAGHVSVPVYPSLKPDSVRQILEHSEAQACFLGATDEKEMASGIPGGVRTILFRTAPQAGGLRWDDLVAATPPLLGCPTRPAEDLATIIYTSGTTGVPKGVMHSFAAIVYNAKTLGTRLGLTAGDRILSYLPLAHIVERVGAEVLSVFLGSHIFFAEGPETFVADLRRAQPTIFLSVPRLLLKFQQNVFAKIPQRTLAMLMRVPLAGRFLKRQILRQMGLDTVCHAACGAAPLPVEILNWYRNLGLNLTEGYGLTETLITHLPAPGAFRPGFVGRAIPGVEIRLGENSELHMRSPMNMLGYYKDPQGSHQVFTADGFFRTGDVAEIASDGQLRIVGRIKEQFKTSKGKYVAPAPIESRLSAHPAVEACCLMGAGLPKPLAVVVISEEARKRCSDPQARAVLEDSFRAHLDEVNAQLDPHERVAFIAIVEGPWTVANGVMTPTLKLKRPILECRYRNLIDDWTVRNRPVVWETAP